MKLNQILIEMFDRQVVGMEPASTVGTSIQGTIQSSYGDLIKMFGQPEQSNGEDKVQAMWNIGLQVRDRSSYDEDDFDIIPISVYDWNEENSVEHVTTWNVGAKTRMDFQLFENHIDMMKD